jgi:hypothetical protein
VVDPACVDAVISAFFDAIEESPLPKVLNLPSLDAEGPVYSALLKALAVRGTEPLVLSAFARPYVTPDFGVKRSGSTRKKLRQDWNRFPPLCRRCRQRPRGRRCRAGVRSVSAARAGIVEGRARHRHAVQP